MTGSHGSTGTAAPAATDSNRERVYNAVLQYQREHAGQSPTIREIAAVVGINSTSVMRYHLTRLAADGRIEIPAEDDRMWRQARGARISGAMWLEPSDVARVARLIQAADDARHALLEHGAAVIDDVIADLERALDAHTPVADALGMPTLPGAAPRGQNGRAA